MIILVKAPKVTKKLKKKKKNLKTMKNFCDCFWLLIYLKCKILSYCCKSLTTSLY